MALIHILDRQNNGIIGTLNSKKGEFTNAKRIDSLSNNNTFDFTALKKFDLLQNRNRILLQDTDGIFHEFLIIYTEQNNRTKKIVRSNASYTDLAKAKVIEPTTLLGATSQTATKFALDGTEWKPGVIDYANIRTIKIEEYTNPLDLLNKIASEFELELSYRVEVNGTLVTGRFVDMKKRIGGFEGKEISFGKDLVDIRRIEDAQNIVTALLGIGPEQEDGTRLTVVVEDDKALQRWGRNSQHLIEVYEPQSTDQAMTEERLRTLTENELKKRIEAVVSYECTAAAIEHIFGRSHEKIRKGQTVRIKDDGYNPPLYLEARINDVEIDPTTNKIIGFKIGKFIEYSKADLKAQVATLKKLLSQKASNAKLAETYELALQQAEEKAAQAENNAKSHADTVAGEARIAAIQAAATDAQTKVNQAKTALEASIAEKADTSAVTALETRMSMAETGIQQTASAIELKANKTDVYTKTEADGKISTAVNNAKADIKLTTDSISQSVSSLQGTVNNQGTRLSSVESTITQHAGLIASKAESSTVTALGTRVTTAEQNINGLTGQISQKVSKTDYNGNTIASLINQTAEEVSISAQKINFDGHVFGTNATFKGKVEGAQIVGSNILSEDNYGRVSITNGFLSVESKRNQTFVGINGSDERYGSNVKVELYDSNDAPIWYTQMIYDRIRFFSNGNIGEIYATNEGLYLNGRKISDPDGVVAYGSNANGYYARFANGIQICWHTKNTTNLVDTPYGSLYYSGSDIWTFPAQFIDVPAFFANVKSAVGISWAGLGADAVNVNSASFSVFSPVRAYANAFVSLLAIGKWR
ncbi:phage tail spike protein [Caldifermentibacillus hisashii]|uniref:phage tail spike protein n=1 Tax=Caldifermentibacillus hisashii TaxID=996558 RepID=UPI0030E97352